MEEADLFCRDILTNLKTVQSYGYTQLIVEKYENLLESALKI